MRERRARAVAAEMREALPVMRLLRHRDVKTTTGTYGHLVVEDLRDAINLRPPSPFAASVTIRNEENQRFEMERETGVEPATLSLGS